MNPIHIPVGSLVKVTAKTIKTMKNGNKSIHHYPSQSYIDHIKCYVGQIGKVERQFLPGYDFNLKFSDGQVFHIRNDRFVEVVD